MILFRLAAAALLVAATPARAGVRAPSNTQGWNADEDWNADDADSPKWSEVSDEEWNGEVALDNKVPSAASKNVPSVLVSRRLATAAPTGAPSLDPLDVTFDAGTTPGYAQSETCVPVTLTIAGVDCAIDLSDGSDTITTIESILDEPSQFCVAGTDCSVTITKSSIAGCPARKRHMRALQTTGTLTLECAVCTKTYCADPEPTDCADLGATVAAVKTKVTAEIDGAISTILVPLRNSITDKFDNAVLPANPFTIGKVYNTYFSVLGLWYPAWHDGVETCKNDGGAPLYMTKTSSFVRPSLEACCLAFYSWDFETCMALGGADTALYSTDDFFVDYASDSCKQNCVAAPADGLNCGGLIPKWKTAFKTAAECCSTKLFWLNEANCVTKSMTGVAVDPDDPDAPIPAGSLKYYVDWKKYVCVKDCAVNDADGSCGGLANSWDTLYVTAEACCETHLSWKEDACLGASAGMDPEAKTYTGKYFLSWSDNKCLKDCDPDIDGCSQVPPPVQLYDGVEECCDYLGGVNKKYCEARTVGAYSNQWQVVNNKCVQDCDPMTGGPCAGVSPSNPFFATSTLCCSSTAMNGVDSSQCVHNGAPSTGTGTGTGSGSVPSPTPPPTFTDVYFKDWDTNKCLQDCDPLSDLAGGVTCAQLPPPIESYTSIDLCCTSFGSAVKPEYCKTRSEGTYTSLWQVSNIHGGKCIQDCASGPPCLSSEIKPAETFYADASACCSQPAVSWLTFSDCVYSG